jgi:hypothetical protein
MRRQISDLEKKELAYTKTIQEQHTAFTSHCALEFDKFCTIKPKDNLGGMHSQENNRFVKSC